MKRNSMIFLTGLGLCVALLPLPASAEDCVGNKETIGTVAGAIIGGILGSNVGKGSGRTVATVVGAVAGGYAGNRIGESMDCNDQRYHSQATHNALENQPAGQPASWNNPDSGHSGTITPVKTWQQEDGRYCRDFTQSIVIDGRVEEAQGTACRGDDGVWRIANNDVPPQQQQTPPQYEQQPTAQDEPYRDDRYGGNTSVYGGVGSEGGGVGATHRF